MRQIGFRCATKIEKDFQKTKISGAAVVLRKEAEKWCCGDMRHQQEVEEFAVASGVTS